MEMAGKDMQPVGSGDTVLVLMTHGRSSYSSIGIWGTFGIAEEHPILGTSVSTIPLRMQNLSFAVGMKELCVAVEALLGLRDEEG